MGILIELASIVLVGSSELYISKEGELIMKKMIHLMVRYWYMTPAAFNVFLRHGWSTTKRYFEILEIESLLSEEREYLDELSQFIKDQYIE